MSFSKIEHAIYPDTINIFAYTANICNQSCPYCLFSHFLKKKHNYTFLDLNVLKDFILHIYNTRHQNIYVELIGGEPTLDNSIINFTQCLNEYYPNIRVGLYTNFTQDISLYQELAKNNVAMTFTWHSQHSIEYNNVFINKLSLLPKSIFNINTDIHIMYEPDNIEESISMFKILKEKYNSTELYLLDHNFETLEIYFLKDTFYTNEQIELYNNVKKQYNTKAYNKSTLKTIGINGVKYHDIYDIYDRAEFYKFKNWVCDAGYNYMYIDITGKIYPCLNYREENSHCMGDIYNFNSLEFKKHVCKFDSCPCVWEAAKINLLNYKKTKYQYDN